MANSRNMVSIIGAVPERDRTRCPEGFSVPCRHRTPVADAQLKHIFSNVEFSKKKKYKDLAWTEPSYVRSLIDGYNIIRNKSRYDYIQVIHSEIQAL